MAWLLFAVMQPLINAIINLFDKYMLSKRIKNYYSYGIIVGLTTVTISLIMWSISKPQNTNIILIGIAAGMFYGTCYFLYFHLFTKSEASRVIGIIYVYPAIVALTSRILLKEQLSTIKYTAIILTVIGAIILGMEKKAKWELTHSFWIAVLIALNVGIVDTMDKYLLQHLTTVQVFSVTYTGVGTMLLLPMLSKKVRKDIKQTIPTIPIIIPMTILSMSATAFFLMAAQQIQVAIVSAIATLQPALVFIGTMILSKFAPHVIKETLKPKLIAYKTAGIFLVVAGAIILTL
ncbi:EamA family transporter [Candidatus Woesearchaeota archaeon]|nr:EamA family transporter [Candidatus Woesearchaeota archaeon]